MRVIYSKDKDDRKRQENYDLLPELYIALLSHEGFGKTLDEKLQNIDSTIRAALRGRLTVREMLEMERTQRATQEFLASLSNPLSDAGIDELTNTIFNRIVGLQTAL